MRENEFMETSYFIEAPETARINYKEDQLKLYEDYYELCELKYRKVKADKLL